LGDFLVHDEKGKRLPGYLSKQTAALAAEQQGVADEVEALTTNINHIKDIVTRQQSYAGSASFVEAVKIDDLLDDAIGMHADILARQQVTVIKNCPDLPPLPLDKSRLLQTLVNLISNASQALESVTDRPRQVMVRGIANDDGRSLQIRVEDNGEGIAPENLPRLFIHGFTTRKDGHGFGLHSCALAAQGMGGSLRVESEGPGKGAIFTLELPIEGGSQMR
jgi:signal transduction histidine kinase